VEHHGHLREQSLAGRTMDPDLAKALATTNLTLAKRWSANRTIKRTALEG